MNANPPNTASNLPKLALRPYQEPVFWSEAGLLVLHWSRQIGKSYVLAAWAVHRLLTRPGRLVTVLSNSRDNGGEFIQKCAEICRMLALHYEEVDLSPDDLIENMRVEVRVTRQGKVGRIKVLAANPRTARGFSGDLILDEFAFHENSVAIWDAAEPIISSNPDFLCRISSTGNGRFNKFYQLAALGVAAQAGVDGLPMSEAGCPVSRVPRSLAYQMGVKIYDPATREPITPEEARRRSLDKRSYDQNYECGFNDENMSLLNLELISAAEYETREGQPKECVIEADGWSRPTIEWLRTLKGPLGVGVDVGRTRDLTSICVGERQGGVILTRALLRLSGMRLPAQLAQLEPVLTLPNFGRAEIDATGIGLGLAEFAQERAGVHRVGALNFASREHRRVGAMVQDERALVTELMALELLSAFEARQFRIPCEAALRDALRKPERVQTASGVRIAVERDEAGHADEFWSMALMQRALTNRAPGIQSARDVVMGAPALGRGFTPRRIGGGEDGETFVPGEAALFA